MKNRKTMKISFFVVVQIDTIIFRVHMEKKIRHYKFGMCATCSIGIIFFFAPTSLSSISCMKLWKNLRSHAKVKTETWEQKKTILKMVFLESILKFRHQKWKLFRFFNEIQWHIFDYPLFLVIILATSCWSWSANRHERFETHRAR